MKDTTRTLGTTITFTLLIAACGEELDPLAELEFREATVAPTRATRGAGYVNNGLHDPQLGGIDPAHPLGTDAGLDGSLLDDPDRLDTAKYVVECALTEDVTLVKLVDGVSTDFHGALGLAPEWEDGTCDEDCQEWVTACLLARTNVSGQTVALWLKGDHPELGTGTNLAYPIYEASFFGNLFANQASQHVCPGLLVGPLLAQLQGRTCSAVLGEYCDMTSYSACTTLPLLSPRCGVQGLVTAPTLTNCRRGSPPSGSGFHTISSYVQAL